MRDYLSFYYEVEARVHSRAFQYYKKSIYNDFMRGYSIEDTIFYCESEYIDFLKDI